MIFTDHLCYGLMTKYGGLAYAPNGRHRAIFNTRKEALAYAATIAATSKVVKVKAEYTIL